MRDTVAERVIAIVADRTGRRPHEVRPDQLLGEDLNADSLALVEIAMDAEREIGRMILDTDMEHWETVADLIRFVERARTNV